MRCKHGRAATVAVISAGLLGAVALPRAYAQAEAAQRPIIGEGEINANDVYVRSGDSLNHYTIIKLKAGDRVSIVGERGEWYEILPPEGTFSLVSGDYVDTADDKTGVINGANVRVRAGSSLNDNKYTVQTQLNKGAAVEILGRNPDGFFRIKPPAGATVWISKQFVNLPGEIRHMATTSSTETPPVASDATNAPASSGQPSEQPTGSVLATPMPDMPRTSRSYAVSPMSNGATEALQKKLSDIDTALNREFAKPTTERDFEPFLSQYRAIAAEAGEGFIQQYAQRRVDEVQVAMEATSSISHWKKIDEIAEAKRREFRSARAAIPELDAPAPSIEAKGELRISALFPPGGTPERYRLIDPSTSSQRTIAYVEIPPGSNIRVNEYLNKFVGVRALERRVQTGGVNPIPIYIADDLVLLEPPAVQSSATITSTP